MDFDIPGMDTKTLSEEGVDMAVKNLSGKPMTTKDGKPITIKLLGPDSIAYRKANRDLVRKRVRAANAAEPEPSFEENEAESIALLASLTVGWHGITNGKGEPVACTREAAAALYERFPAIRDQVDVFVAQRGNFVSAA